MLDPEVDKKMDAIAERLFGTQNDPDQIPINKESGDKLDALTPNWCQYRLDERGDPIAWVVVVPTTREIAKRFLSKEITERQILELTKKQETYNALYLCVAVTVPEYRRKGLAMELMHEAIAGVPLTADTLLFGWPYSPEGKNMMDRWNKTEQRHIFLRE